MQIEKEAVKCACCHRQFVPVLEGQGKCIGCIMEHKPSRPLNKSNSKVDPAFVEWFIYHWRRFRNTARELKARRGGGGHDA